MSQGLRIALKTASWSTLLAILNPLGSSLPLHKSQTYTLG